MQQIQKRTEVARHDSGNLSSVNNKYGFPLNCLLRDISGSRSETQTID